MNKSRISTIAVLLVAVAVGGIFSIVTITIQSAEAFVDPEPDLAEPKASSIVWLKT
jgi:hypothetical protein